MLTLTLTLFLTTALLIPIHLLYTFYIYPLLLSPLRSIPLLRTPLRFRLYQWLYTEPNPRQIDVWLKKTPHTGLIRYHGILGAERVMPLSPAAVREVLVNKVYGGHFERSPLNRQRFGTLFGEGLFVVEGEEHRHIRDLYPVFWSKALELTSSLENFIQTSAPKAKDGSSSLVELVTFTSHAALDIIGVAVWGKDFNAMREPHSDFVTSYSRIFRGSARANQQAKMIYAAALAVPMITLRKLFPCEFFENLTGGIRAIRVACKAAIDEKKGFQDDVDRDDDDVKAAKQHRRLDEKRKDILSQAMSASLFNEAQLSGQMMNLLAAGHETTSLAVTWSCYLLCKRPDVQDRLRGEIRAKLPRHFPPPPGLTADEKADETEQEAAPTTVTYDMLDALPYLHAVVRESLRVIPPAPLIRREASKDTTILNQAIPKGTGVILSAWHINQNTYEWGPDAADFRPERWLPDESVEREEGGEGDRREGGIKAVEEVVGSRFAYLPFMTGPRSCIGEEFAKGEVYAMLVALVGRLRMRLENEEEGYEPDVIWGITAKPLRLMFRMDMLEG